jgi:exonuclease SbcC
LTGSSLLRNGCAEGKVELYFEVDGKDVVVTRTLKRGSGVTQHVGTLFVDGIGREYTATELKQRILDLLQYPPELLTKKSLIYRYTVYTPQDEMKSILIGEDSVRLDTLRRVFGVDKYKRIMAGADVFLKQIRSRMARFDEQLVSVDTKKKNKEQLLSEARRLDLALREKEPALQTLQQQFDDAQRRTLTLEKELQLHRQRQQELQAIETSLTHYQREVARFQATLPPLAQDITCLHQQLSTAQVVDADALPRLQEKHARLDENLRTLRLKIHEITLQQGQHSQLMKDITQLDTCPLCRQPVSMSHRHDVTKREQEQVALLTQQLKDLQQQEQLLLVPLEKLTQEMEEAKKKMHQHELHSFQSATLKDKEKQHAELKRLLHEGEHQIRELEQKKKPLVVDGQRFLSLEQEHTTLRSSVDQLHSRQKILLTEQASLQKEREVVDRDLTRVNDELTQLSHTQQHFDHLQRFKGWLESCFLPLMELMEQQVMLKVHQDFDKLFQKWFGMLVDAEVMKIRIDESFQPVIEQNGHDLEYAFLSGGEKTAAALAYRLALNQVINTIVGVVKTRDLLILDEPTDGFSSTQLDRMRDLLDDLDAKQIILVSHEDKIESFVQSVIRIEKQDHVSKVM